MNGIALGSCVATVAQGDARKGIMHRKIFGVMRGIWYTSIILEADARTYWE